MARSEKSFKALAMAGLAGPAEVGGLSGAGIVEAVNAGSMELNARTKGTSRIEPHLRDQPG